MNKVKPLNVGATLAGTVVVLYLLCALFVLLVPNGTEWALNLVAHSLNLNPMFDEAPDVTFVGVLGGTLAVALYFFVAGAIFGWIYNRFDR